MTQTLTSSCRSVRFLGLPMPPMLLVGVLAMGLLAACTAQTGAPASTSKPTDAVAAAGSVSPAEPAAPVSVEAGAELFKKYCVLCHGANAEGYAADNAPSLMSPTFRTTVSTEFLKLAIIRGRPGTAMAGYSKDVGGPLGPGEIDSLVAFLQKDAPPAVQLGPYAGTGDAENGRGIYEQNCQKCHGTATQRSTAVHLANPVFLGTATPAFLRYAVQNGRPGTAMPAWNDKLRAKEIDDVVAYVRSMNSVLPPLPGATQPARPPVPPWGPIVINPQGKEPEFTLREDRFVPIAQVKKALDEKRKMVIVDARPPSDWLNLHITGSLPLPHYELSAIDKLPNDGTWIIAYCACPHHASGVVVDELRRRGIKTSAVLDEGVFAWQKAGYPVEQAPGMAGLPNPPPPGLPPMPPGNAPMVPVSPAGQ